MTDMKTSKIQQFLSFSLLFLLANLNLQGEQAKWLDLFNGQNLDGWHNPYPHGTASVKNGVIELVADRKFFFAYNEKFSDFIMTAEIKLPKGKANSGILFRSQKKEKRLDVWLPGRSGRL